MSLDEAARKLAAVEDVEVVQYDGYVARKDVYKRQISLILMNPTTETDAGVIGLAPTSMS